MRPNRVVVTCPACELTHTLAVESAPKHRMLPGRAVYCSAREVRGVAVSGSFQLYFFPNGAVLFITSYKVPDSPAVWERMWAFGDAESSVPTMIAKSYRLNPNLRYVRSAR